MPQRSPRLARSAAQSELAAALAELRRQLQIPDGFPAEVQSEATEAASFGLDADAIDLREIEFRTIDPAGSTDLDQALHLTRDAGGLLVRYAIADVGWFVRPDRAIDQEARRRGQTLYAPDDRAPLHPTVLSEGAASLLPGQDRLAYVWRFRLDSDDQVVDVGLDRAIVRSRRQWNYQDAQRAADGSDPPESLRLLLEFGDGRQRQESARGGASLNFPNGEIVLTERGYVIERRTPLPIEDANAQLSLMTGMAAARIMLDGGVGILRTMPPAEPSAIEEFRRQTRALGLDWREGVAYGDYLRELDRSEPRALAVLQAATSLFRGAGYSAFDGEPPVQQEQAAIAAPYAHVTAPIRRLVDRFGLIVCDALVHDRPVPEWVREALPTLPQIMSGTDDLASRLDAAALNRVEAALLTDRADEIFEAVVLFRKDERRRIQLTDPVVVANLNGAGNPGDQLRVRLVSADVATGEVAFEPAP
ncbi:RNB domain-containing ribonuclease [Microlunatus elymi]|uniref:RNB domain-containing ribonuclease n=1 Tax=Microlunatus elymi TaxID=2596828 RepID=A0A516Q0U1_9ACTN|nr:RNB domain-containing ribonuclease [Microlunatus elymi]QDP96992.1 RNB domain-containing ribonuclease [Microlunatus elymi]